MSSDPKKVCTVCTMPNVETANTCVMCDAPLTVPASENDKQSTCTGFNRLDEKTTNTAVGISACIPLHVVEVQTKKCVVCTLANELTALNCDYCGAPLPSAP